MTDNEIIKALECCGKNPPVCSECEYRGKCNKIDCYDYLKRDALALINRQQAEIENYKKIAETQQTLAMDRHFEIERLKAEIERLTGYNENLQTANTTLSNEILEAKVEAYKEFAERLKEEGRKYCGEITEDDIDNILKEMEGAADAPRA